MLLRKISSAEKAGLGMPLDINQVTEDELLLIKPGFGPGNGKKILDLRK